MGHIFEYLLHRGRKNIAVVINICSSESFDVDLFKNYDRLDLTNATKVSTDHVGITSHSIVWKTENLQLCS